MGVVRCVLWCALCSGRLSVAVEAFNGWLMCRRSMCLLFMTTSGRAFLGDTGPMFPRVTLTTEVPIGPTTHTSNHHSHCKTSIPQFMIN